MATTLHKLSAQAVENAKPGRIGDGGGLWLVTDPPRKDGTPGSRRWVFLFRWQTKLKEMGLGGYPAVSLAKARQKAKGAREDVASGVNPIEAKRQKANSAPVPFGELADKYIKDHTPSWKSRKQAGQWTSSLATHAASLRPIPVGAITTEDVLAVLKPIWLTRAETASRVRGRIESILDAAKANGLRAGENPARWRGHLDHLLPRRRKLSRGHFAALPYSDIGVFMEQLRTRDGAAARALEFTILTAARTGMTLGARWSEIDRKAKVWTIPAERMKGGRPHRVPLSAQTLALLDRSANGTEFVFPAEKKLRPKTPGPWPLSDGAMERVVDRMKLATPVTVHGFRSSFRDWVSETTSFPSELAEIALAHVVGDETELAYRRGDALERRRKLMDAWARYCEPRAVANVVHLARA